MGDFSNVNSEKLHVNASITQHENYSPNISCNHYDIALLKLAHPVDPQYVLPLCTKNYSNTTLTVSGMGLEYVRYGYFPEKLQDVKVTQTPGAACQYPDTFWNPPTQICASAPGFNRGTLIGDSGGPLFPLGAAGEPLCVYGLVCCGNVRLWMGLYTRVTAFSHWIESHMH